MKSAELQTIEQNLARFIEQQRSKAGDALIDVGLDFLGKSSRRAPVDTGDLRGSGYLVTERGTQVAKGGKEGDVVPMAREKRWGKPPMVEAGWGVPYAVVQHERTDFQHPRGGEAKFAERTLQENFNRYRDYIAGKAGV